MLLPPTEIIDNEADIVMALLAGENVTRCKNPSIKCRHWARFAQTEDRPQGGYWCVCCNAGPVRTIESIERRYLCDGTRVKDEKTDT